MTEVKYKIYATLLDAFTWYLDSESEEATQEFINKVNRVPFESEAAEKGTAFNNLIDVIISGSNPMVNGFLYSGNEEIIVNHKSRSGIDYRFSFKTAIVREFAELFQGASSQIHTEAILPTRYGNVLLYGYIDEILAPKTYDIKTTGSYTFPKFNRHWQHILYPFCLNENGIALNEFQYTITDFSNVYVEDYEFKPEIHIPLLKAHVEHLIEVIEIKRDVITDKKIFALD